MCDLQALVSARALNPEQYADAEKRRLEKRAAELDAAVAKERQRRAHAAKLRGVLSRLDEQCSEATLQLLMKGNPRYVAASLDSPHGHDTLARGVQVSASCLHAEIQGSTRPAPAASISRAERGTLGFIRRACILLACVHRD